MDTPTPLVKMTTFERIQDTPLDRGYSGMVYVTLKGDPERYEVLAADKKQMTSVAICFCAKTTDWSGEGEKWEGLGTDADFVFGSAAVEILPVLGNRLYVSELMDALFVWGKDGGERWVAMKDVVTTTWQDVDADHWKDAVV